MNILRAFRIIFFFVFQDLLTFSIVFLPLVINNGTFGYLDNRYALARKAMNDWQSRFEFSKMMNKEETIKAIHRNCHVI